MSNGINNTGISLSDVAQTCFDGGSVTDHFSMRTPQYFLTQMALGIAYPESDLGYGKVSSSCYGHAAKFIGLNLDKLSDDVEIVLFQNKSDPRGHVVIVENSEVIFDSLGSNDPEIEHRQFLADNGHYKYVSERTPENVWVYDKYTTVTIGEFKEQYLKGTVLDADAAGQNPAP